MVTELVSFESEEDVGLSFPVVDVLLGVLHVVRVHFLLHFVNIHKVLRGVHKILGVDEEWGFDVMVVMVTVDINVSC